MLRLDLDKGAGAFGEIVGELPGGIRFLRNGGKVNNNVLHYFKAHLGIIYKHANQLYKVHETCQL
jgi:hypothetical protein